MKDNDSGDKYLVVTLTLLLFTSSFVILMQPYLCHYHAALHHLKVYTILHQVKKSHPSTAAVTQALRINRRFAVALSRGTGLI